MSCGAPLQSGASNARPYWYQPRRGRGATDREPLLGAQAADLRLDGVDDLQALDHLVRERRLRRLVHLDEFAPGMRQTKRQPDRTALTTRERLVGGIAVHLQNAGEARQLPGDLLGATAVGEYVGNRRRRRAAPRAIIHRMRPELAGPGAMSSRIKHRHRRLVAEQPRRSLDRLELKLIKSLEPPCRTLHPAGERRAIELDAVAR